MKLEVEVPDNGLTPEQIAAINEQVELGEELSTSRRTPWRVGTNWQTPSADSTNSQNKPNNPKNLNRNHLILRPLIIWILWI